MDDIRTPSMPPPDELVLRKKIQAFKTIYRAIQEVGSCLDYFLSGKESLSPKEYQREIEVECGKQKEPMDKTVNQAWQLAQIHYDACSEDNEDLFTAIYKSICAMLNSRSFLVRWLSPAHKAESALNENELMLEKKYPTLRSIKNRKHNAEIKWHIYYNLANPIPPDQIWARPRSELRF